MITIQPIEVNEVELVVLNSDISAADAEKKFNDWVKANPTKAIVWLKQASTTTSNILGGQTRGTIAGKVFRIFFLFREKN